MGVLSSYYARLLWDALFKITSDGIIIYPINTSTNYGSMGWTSSSPEAFLTFFGGTTATGVSSTNFITALNYLPLLALALLPVEWAIVIFGEVILIPSWFLQVPLFLTGVFFSGLAY